MTDHSPLVESSDDIWKELRTATQARIGLGRTGNALPTVRVLDLKTAHSSARDAVHIPLDAAEFASTIENAGIGTPQFVQSEAQNRSVYLRRPDLGRTPSSLSHLTADHSDLGFVLADGLSPRGLLSHGAGLLHALIAELSTSYTIAPPVIATQARVAIGDHIGAALGVRTVVVIIGERPGLSVADSLGIYLTHLPGPGCTDADRNCISNIHPPDGQSYIRAARTVETLLAGALKLGRSGVELKDETGMDLAGTETLTIARPSSQEEPYELNGSTND
ncbi:ethanolamine ammonia-lyase [Rhodococcus sp. Leaf278]|uniref:ethanolamine ammonia-lyase subunit EutC n=1 Tax=Rhodococcus sp. Leaf278 TaxID=1736319 RepID=UPI00070EEF15|nr:ethanolamine ammonia-lyase subunit EutC [Rhodococcus sp. Leaf278]KQU46642.1 ethanolamine ammonia-lyase [Rhodococcus sp. Leaf278]